MAFALPRKYFRSLSLSLSLSEIQGPRVLNRCCAMSHFSDLLETMTSGITPIRPYVVIKNAAKKHCVGTPIA
jgi:hypothetical protein